MCLCDYYRTHVWVCDYYRTYICDYVVYVAHVCDYLLTMAHMFDYVITLTRICVIAWFLWQKCVIILLIWHARVIMWLLLHKYMIMYLMYLMQPCKMWDYVINANTCMQICKYAITIQDYVVALFWLQKYIAFRRSISYFSKCTIRPLLSQTSSMLLQI